MLTTLKLAIAATVAAATGSLALMPEQLTPVPTKKQDAPLVLAQFPTAMNDLFGPAEVQQDKRVTVRINGSVDEVVKWLGDTGISFVLEDKALGSRRLSINLVNQPVEDAIAAIADALGSEWSKRGQIYVLGSPAVAPKAFFPATPKAPKTDQLRREIEAARKAGKDVKAWTFDMPAAPTAPRSMTEQERKEFEASMKKLYEDVKSLPAEVRAWSKDVKAPYGMTEQQKKEFEASMKKLREDMKSLPAEVRVWSDAKPMTDAQRKEFEKAMGRVRIELKGVPGVPIAPRAGVRSGDMKALFKSISSDQRAKHDKQGYLKVSDLSPAQRKLLGSPTGNFTISINIDGQKLTVKNP